MWRIDGGTSEELLGLTVVKTIWACAFLRGDTLATQLPD